MTSWEGSKIGVATMLALCSNSCLTFYKCPLQALMAKSKKHHFHPAHSQAAACPRQLLVSDILSLRPCALFMQVSVRAQQKQTARPLFPLCLP